MGSTYVIKSTFFRGNPISGQKQIFKSAAQERCSCRSGASTMHTVGVLTLRAKNLELPDVLCFPISACLGMRKLLPSTFQDFNVYIVFLKSRYVCANNCISRTCSKTVSWKYKIKNVVKYYVYLDILLMGSTYVIKSTFFRGNPISGQKQIFKSAAQERCSCRSGASTMHTVGVLTLRAKNLELPDFLCFPISACLGMRKLFPSTFQDFNLYISASRYF